MGGFKRFCIVLPVCLASAFVVYIPASLATPVDDLKATFGTPKDFADKFENTVKERSDQIIGLLIAASGFVYAIKVFTN
jgi:hypothetical protein